MLMRNGLLQLALIAGSGVCGASASLAFEGRWEIDGAVSRTATITKSEAGYSVALEVATRGCVGMVEGMASAKGNTLTLRAAPAEVGGDVCIVTLRKRRNRLVLREISGCLYWHGTACDFSGTLRRQQ